MKYSLFVYEVPGSWHDLSHEEKAALHDDYHAVATFPGVVGHYRLRPPQTTTTVRVENDQIVKTAGPLANTYENLRAIYLLDSDDEDSVIQLAAGIPATRTGGAVEVRPLTEP